MSDKLEMYLCLILFCVITFIGLYFGLKRIDKINNGEIIQISEFYMD